MNSINAAPALVLLDWNLPDGNGLQLMEPLRQRWPQAKTLVLTLHDSPQHRQLALSAGAHGFVSKIGVDNELLPAMPRTMAN